MTGPFVQAESAARSSDVAAAHIGKGATPNPQNPKVAIPKIQIVKVVTPEIGRATAARP